MEQNQSQGQVQVQLSPTPKQQQWQKIRNQFANNEESISQTEDVIALIEKWIWIQYQQQFKQLEKNLLQRSDLNRNLKQILADLIQQQKTASWIINQKYSMEQVNQLIVKLRQSITSLLNKQQPINPQALQQQLTSKDNPSKLASSPNQQEYVDQRILANYSSVLPQIKPKGKIYHPKEMTASFHLSKETQQDYQIRSPFMFQRDKKPVQPKESLFNNKYLKMAFRGFCKQGYNSNGLFEDISKDADKMTLNKWMIFCKQFGFMDKFHKSQLVSIYQAATKFASVMYIQDFLTAVAILQEKHVNKFHTGEYNFVGDVLKIGTEAALRVKMDNLKVSYAGPRRNFFQYATYSQVDRADEIQRQRAFQVKKKERQVVLIKGMFEQHLKDEIQQLKSKRQNNKASSRLGYSLNKINNTKQNIEQIKEEKMEQTTNTKSSRLKNLNYSKLFHINRGHSTQKDYNYITNTTSKQSPTNMYKTELNQSKLITHKKIDTKTVNNNSQVKPIAAEVKHEEKSKQEDKLDGMWLTKIRTDSQQSDEILKEHLMMQKKIKNTNESRTSNRMKDIMAQMQQRSKQVQKIKQQIDKQNSQQDNDLMQTQVNFNQQGTRV